MARRTTGPNSKELKILKAKTAQDCIERHSKICCEVCMGKRCGVYDYDKLILEHIDNNPGNWDPGNLQLASRKCNYEKNPPKLYKLKGESFDFSPSLTHTTDYLPKPQSAEMARNMKSEPEFRKWLKGEMKKRLIIELEEIINSGAEKAGVSTYTIRNNYLKKLTSKLGPYRIDGEPKHLHWKREQLEKEFGKEVDKFTK